MTTIETADSLQENSALYIGFQLSIAEQRQYSFNPIPPKFEHNEGQNKNNLIYLIKTRKTKK